MVISREILLEVPSTEELHGWIERNLPKIIALGFERMSFQNVSEPLQQRIEQLLNR